MKNFLKRDSVKAVAEYLVIFLKHSHISLGILIGFGIVVFLISTIFTGYSWNSVGTDLSDWGGFFLGYILLTLLLCHGELSEVNLFSRASVIEVLLTAALIFLCLFVFWQVIASILFVAAISIWWLYITLFQTSDSIADIPVVWILSVQAVALCFAVYAGRAIYKDMGWTRK